MRPGEVYRADLEEAGVHFVIVVSREELNRGRDVVAVLCTSQAFDRRSKLPNCVAFDAGAYCFHRPTVAKCEEVQLIERDILEGPLARIADEDFRDVVKALGYVFEADCEPI